MRLLYVHDFNIRYSENNIMWFTVGLPEAYFDRFFDAGFNEVALISRKTYFSGSLRSDRGWLRGVNACLKSVVPNLKSYWSLFRPETLWEVVKEIRKSDLVVVNFPTIIGLFVIPICLVLRKKYCVEVAGDETNWSSKPGGAFVRKFFGVIMPPFIASAAGAAYVTQYLQKKYPNSKDVLVASNVNLTNFHEREFINSPLAEKPLINLGFVGGLSERKGVRTLFHALVACRREGLDGIKLTLVGGHADADWEQIASDLGVREFIEFRGLCTPDEVFQLNKSFDIYLQPSHSEGLPRALIEAMACGTPVIASVLPGFLEILDRDDCCEIGDAEQLSQRIIELANDVELYNRKVASNFQASKNFSYGHLRVLRSDFYQRIRAANCSPIA